MGDVSDQEAERSKLLKKLYTQARYGVAFSSWNKIWKKASEYDPGVKKEDVKKFLRNKLSHSLYVPKPTKFPMRKMFVMSPEVQVSVDLLELSKMDRRKNYPFRYLFCQIDNFSRLLQMVAIKTKNIESVRGALVQTFRLYKPKSILCDKESSFYSNEILAFLKEQGVKLISQKSAPTLRWKNAIVERCIRTIRMIIVKYCEEIGITRFVDKLNVICDIFNSRVNRTIKCAPKRMHYDRDEIARYQQILENELKKSADAPHSPNDLKLGDHVRYKTLSKTFAKETGKSFSRSVHVIVDVKKSRPKVYRIYPSPRDQDRYFYRQELFRVDEINRNDAPVEKVLSKKTLPNGEKLHECLLLGHEKREWLTSEELARRFILFNPANSLLLEDTKIRNSYRDNASPTKPIIKTRSQTKQKFVSDRRMTRSQAARQ